MMDTARLRSLLKSRIAWVVGGLLLLTGLYAVLGFYVAPRVVQDKAIAYFKETYGRDLRIAGVRIHPFKLQVEVTGLGLPDADGKQMLGFRRLFVDFEAWASLWQRTYVFREVTLDAPQVRAVLRPDGSLNLADLAPKSEEPREEGPPPAVWIQSLALNNGAIDLLNQLRRHPVERHFAPVTFSLKDFRTTREGGGFSLAARSAQDERFDWQGHFALTPQVNSSGTFAIHALRVAGVAEFVQDELPFQLPQGLIELEGRYTITLAEPLRLDVTLPSITVSDAALRAKDVNDNWVTIPSLKILGTALALPARTFTVDDVQVEGLRASVWKAPDGSINLDRLFASATGESRATPPATETNVTATATKAATGASSPAATKQGDFQVAVRHLGLQSAQIEFEDRSVQPAAKFVLAPLDLGVSNASLDLGRPLPVEFHSGLNGAGSITGRGEIVPQPFTAQVDLDLNGFQLRDVQPYANGATDLTIRSGTVGAKGAFALAPSGSKQPALEFTGDVVLAGFHSVDNALEQDFLNFDRVDLAHLHYAMTPDALSIERVRIAKPFAKVIVASNGTLNASAVFNPKGTAAAAAAASAAKTQEAAPARKKARAEVQAEKRAAAEAAKARMVAASTPLKESGMPIRIGEVVVTNGTMDFADFSVQPNFAAAVQSLSGNIKGLSSDPNSRAKVKLAGNVGEFSPVHIEGTVQPFAYDRYTDMGLKFENISLPIFNPYSGRFAGYNIAKGKLTTELHYQIEARRLQAQHHIRIDQLEWGDATASKGEATLPVKFATSLLKDADGVINLDVPISGTLDDPSFRVGPIVWQVIKNLLTKAVTLPFKALGALFKGAEDAQFIDFAAGTATLEPAAAERLAALGKSLAPKQDLRLEIPIGTDAAADGAALAQARYAQALDQAMRTVLLGKKKAVDASASVPPFDSLELDRRIDVLDALYTKLYGAEPKPPEPAAPPEGTSRKDAKALAQQATLTWLESQCRQRTLPSPGDYDTLGQARAEAIQHAVLTDTGLAPNRVFVVKEGKVTTNASNVRLELSVK